MEQQIKPDMTEKVYVKMLNDLWNALIQHQFSFIITDKMNRIVGVSLGFDANNEPKCNFDGPHGVIFELFGAVEAPVR